MAGKFQNLLSKFFGGANPPGEAQVTQPASPSDVGRIVVSSLPHDPPSIEAAEAQVAPEWKVGDVILDLYEVKQVHEGGGMGLVYRVHHRGWNMELAVKSPRAEFSRTEAQREGFEHECETWINLGLHPHIASCHYVRRLDGIPRVFAEYVEGGTLKEWIDTRKLYEGGPSEALPRILDVAIQMAWGLDYAHERGLIHQDVKPANVLMLPDGTAKITDFGLAKARANLDESIASDKQRSVLVSWGGMTPAYCSPEQAGRQRLSCQTDIWSLGVCVLEMFVGEVCWQSGVAAPEVLNHLGQVRVEGVALPEMPEAVAQLLRECFAADPAQRPANSAVVADRLRTIHRTATGDEYQREAPEAARLLADGSNNKAVSLLDLGREDEALKELEQALTVEPTHLEATYNMGVLQWNKGSMTDEKFLQNLQQANSNHNGWLGKYMMGLVHLARADSQNAELELKAALEKSTGNVEVDRALERVRYQASHGAGCLREFKGHADIVSSVALLPDGRLALSGSWDKTLRLWDVATGQCVAVLEGHSDRVESIVVSASGRWALSASNDKTVRLWDLAGRLCLRTFEGHKEGVTSVAISPDGRWALSGSKDALMHLWDVATGQAVRTFEGHGGWVTSVIILPDSAGALSGSWDNTPRLWDLATGKCLRQFDGHKEWASSVALSADGRRALSGSWDETLRFWNLGDGQCERILKGHTNKVMSVALSSDGRCAISGGADRTLRYWELATGRCLRTFEGHTGMVESVAISSDGFLALSGSRDLTLRLWSLTPQAGSLSCLPCRPSKVREIASAATAFGACMERAARALAEEKWNEAADAIREARSVRGHGQAKEARDAWRRVARYGVRRDCRTGFALGAFDVGSNFCDAVALSPDGNQALSWNFGDTQQLWELPAGRCLRKFEDPSADPRTAMRSFMGAGPFVAFSPDGLWSLSARTDKTLRLWEVASGRCVRRFEREADCVTCGAISPDGSSVLSGNWNGILCLWDLATGTLRRTFGNHERPVIAVAFFPDGRGALSRCEDGTLRLYELASGRCLRTLETNRIEEGSVTDIPTGGLASSIAVAADGSRVLVADFDKKLRLYDLAMGQCVQTFEGHTEHVRAVAISPDGKWALSGGNDKTLRLWELATGQCGRVLAGHTKRVSFVAFSPDGCQAVSASSDKTIRVWELDWEYALPDRADWDEGAKPYLQAFLAVRCEPRGEESTQNSKPSWSEQEFQKLLGELQRRGFGWLHSEGVRRQLENMAATWNAPPQSPADTRSALESAEGE